LDFVLGGLAHAGTPEFHVDDDRADGHQQATDHQPDHAAARRHHHHDDTTTTPDHDDHHAAAAVVAVRFRLGLGLDEEDARRALTPPRGRLESDPQPKSGLGVAYSRVK
jgi:hypothetical protein